MVYSKTRKNVRKEKNMKNIRNFMKQKKTKEEKGMLTGRRGYNIYDDDDDFYDQMYNARSARKA